MTKNTIRRVQTDRAITEARGHITLYTEQLPSLHAKHNGELLTDLITQTAKNVLFSALQHAPVTNTGHPWADGLLRQATSLATLQAREAVYPAAHSNVTGFGLQQPPGQEQEQEPDDWMRRNAQALEATGKAVRDVFQAMLMACTTPLAHDENGRTARRQAIDLTAHVCTVIDTATNVEAIRERMPTLPTSPSR